MEADWDLLAVVRGCTTAPITTPSPVSSAAPSSPPAPPPADTSHGRPISPYGFQHLQDSYNCDLHNLITCPLDESFNFDSPLHRNQLQPPQEKEHFQVIFGRSTASTITTTTTTTSVGCSSSTTPHTHQRSKKRKNLQKRVCHLAAEGIASDMWAWRKYGQKPIKGSPYPRSYYKCSSSKGCPARKQVERNRSDPKMFIVTYTSEHSHPIPTHRNSLTGSTRHKAAAPPAVEEKGEIKEGDCGEEIMELKDMVMNDDLFVGFEELDDSDGGGFFPDQNQVGWPT